MTLNKMLYSFVNEEDTCKTMLVNDFRDNDDPLKVIEEQTVESIVNEPTDPTYIRWQIFDEIPERVYTIQCDGYNDKDGKPLNDEESIKYLTNGEHSDITLERYDENGNVIDYI